MEEIAFTPNAERFVLDGNAEDERITTGFTKIDQTTRGFRMGNTYLVAGLEKSGKSFFLMDIATHLLKGKTHIGYLNTELADPDFAIRMTAIWDNVPISEIEASATSRAVWTKETANDLSYAGIEDVVNDKAVIDFEKAYKVLEKFVFDGAKVIFVDNLTTFSTQATDNQRGWEILASCISRLVNFAKGKKIVIFAVIHTKQEVIFSETPQGIRSIIDENTPEKIFEKSVTVSRRPTKNDVYGGGGALSQLSGSILIWRPFQYFNEEKLREMAMVILDSFRHCESGIGIEMLFDGASARFTEKHDLYQTAKEIFLEEK